jgi:hypothetical protein
VICLRNDTACHWKVSRPQPFGLMQILKKNSNPKLGQFPPHDHIGERPYLTTKIITLSEFFNFVHQVSRL